MQPDSLNYAVSNDERACGCNNNNGMCGCGNNSEILFFLIIFLLLFTDFGCCRN